AARFAAVSAAPVAMNVPAGLRWPLGWLLILVAWTAWMAPLPAGAGVRELREARIDTAAPGQPPAWRDIVLPYHWDRHHDNRAGRARFEIPFDFDGEVPAEPWGLFFPVIGNGAEVWLNGK